MTELNYDNPTSSLQSSMHSTTSSNIDLNQNEEEEKEEKKEEEDDDNPFEGMI